MTCVNFVSQCVALRHSELCILHKFMTSIPFMSTLFVYKNNANEPIMRCLQVIKSFVKRRYRGLESCGLSKQQASSYTCSETVLALFKVKIINYITQSCFTEFVRIHFSDCASDKKLFIILRIKNSSSHLRGIFRKLCLQ